MLPSVLRRAGAAVRGAGTRSAGTWHKPSLSSELPSPGDGRSRTVTLLPGDGVGPEVIKAAQEAIAATGAGGICTRQCVPAARPATRTPRRAAAATCLAGRVHRRTCKCLCE